MFSCFDFFSIYPWISAKDVCLQSSNNYYDIHFIRLSNIFGYFIICIFNSAVAHNYISSHYCIFLCWIPLWGWPCKTETCKKITACLHIIVCNYSAIVCMFIAHLSRLSWYQVCYEFQYSRLAPKKSSLHVTVSWCVTCKSARDFPWMCSSRTSLSSKLLRQKFPHDDLY